MNIDLTKIVDNGGGYLEPGELHAPWDDVIRKYVPDHPAVRS